MSESLESLPNLGKTTVMWLRAIGVRDHATLADKGIYWAYVQMRKRGFRATTAVLFSLDSALANRPWRSMPEHDKETVLRRLARYERSLDAETKIDRKQPARAGYRGTPGNRSRANSNASDNSSSDDPSSNNSSSHKSVQQLNQHLKRVLDDQLS